jgi:hypothetical protein
LIFKRAFTPDKDFNGTTTLPLGKKIMKHEMELVETPFVSAIERPE